MKTTKELGISLRERNAMVKVRDGLREGRYRHVKMTKLLEGNAKDTGKPVFNMNYPIRQRSCGTVACIGGWMALEMRMKKDEVDSYVFAHEDAGEPLNKLFFPHDYGDGDGYWDSITPKRAAKAIDNFLNTGDPQWASLLPKDSYIAE